MYIMQALHRKLDAVLVHILSYNCSETDYSFCKDLLPCRTLPSTWIRVSPSDPFIFHYFFRSAAPELTNCTTTKYMQYKNKINTCLKNTADYSNYIKK